MKLEIDPQFRDVLPPLEPEAFANLESLIKKHGCRDPLVTWNGVIIDGHNRYDICTRNNLPFNTLKMEFADREAVLDWIDENAVGKRNLTPAQFKDILGRRYNRTKKAVGGTGANQHEQKAQNGTSANTAATLAKQHGVSKNTVKRAGEFAEAVEKLGLGDDVKSGKLKRNEAKIVGTAKRGVPELLDMLNTGEIDFKTAAKVASLPEEKQRLAVAGGVFGINRAAKGLSPDPNDNSPPERVKRDTYTPEEGKNLYIQAKIKLDRINDKDKHFQWAMNEAIAYCKTRLKNTTK